MERNIQFTTDDGFQLAGILNSLQSPRGYSVFCHGISSHKQEYLDMFVVLADRLSKIGVASLRFDFRGHGDSKGTSIDFSIANQLKDLKAALAYLESDKQYAGLPATFVGVSFGAAPGVFTQNERHPFRRLCLFAPVLSYQRTFLKPETAWAAKSFTPKALSEVDAKGYLLLDDEFKVSKALVEQMRTYDPISTLARLTVPVLAIHGTADGLVPCGVTEGLRVLAPNVTVEIIPNMDHGLFVTGDEDGKTVASKALFEKEMNRIVGFLNE